MDKREIEAVFTDRDGVLVDLIDYREGDESVFIASAAQLKLFPRVIEAIKLLNKRNIPLIVVTNQPQIARGLLTPEELEMIHKELLNQLEKQGAKITDIVYCPHHPSKGVNSFGKVCECRKPKPGMILDVANKKGFSLKNCYMIGDRTSDIKAGVLAGCRTIGVRTGYGCEDFYKDAQADFMAEDFFEAVKLLLEGKK